MPSLDGTLARAYLLREALSMQSVVIRLDGTLARAYRSSA